MRPYVESFVTLGYEHGFDAINYVHVLASVSLVDEWLTVDERYHVTV